jgi:hypothetical protein
MQRQNEKFTPMEHIQERMTHGGLTHIYETVRFAGGGENVARLHSLKIARLFAAAPEMYQHLTELCGWLEDEQREDCDAYRQIMALLAKIDGQEWQEAEE